MSVTVAKRVGAAGAALALVVAAQLLVTERYFAAAERLRDSSERADEIEYEYEAALRRARYSMMWGGAATLLSLLLVSWGVWRTMVVPLRRLKDDALRLSQSEAQPGGIDEIGAVRHAVNRLEADYRALFDNGAVGILEFGPEGEALRANPTLARMLGYRPPEELVASTRDVHRNLFADPEHRSRAEELARGGPPIERRTPLLRRDGSVAWTLERSSVVGTDELDPRFLSVLVDITETVKAQDELRELSGLLLESQEQERRRIARDLHDSTGQVLAALEMNLSRLSNLQRSASDALSETGALATQCSREIRSMSYLLHPPLLDELGLSYAVRDYAEGFAKRSGIAVELDLPQETVRAAQDVENALFRVIQEALTNIQRHAASPVAKIRLEHAPDAFVVTVTDEGRGLPPEVLSSDGRFLSRMGVGMRGMEERLRQLGGCLTITSSEHGTMVRGELPHSVPRAAHEAGEPGEALVPAPLRQRVPKSRSPASPRPGTM